MATRQDSLTIERAVTTGFYVRENQPYWANEGGRLLQILGSFSTLEEALEFARARMGEEDLSATAAAAREMQSAKDRIDAEVWRSGTLS